MRVVLTAEMGNIRQLFVERFDSHVDCGFFFFEPGQKFVHYGILKIEKPKARVRGR